MKSFFIVLFLCALIPPAMAAEKEKKIPEYIKEKQAQRLQDLKQYDTNKDGVLQPAELAKSRDAQFGAMDQNKDGVISPQEQATSLDKFKPVDTKAQNLKAKENDYKRKEMRLKSNYKNTDANGDGVVSKEEYEKYTAERQQYFDRNGDGVISADEYRTEDEKLPGSYTVKPRIKN